MSGTIFLVGQQHFLIGSLLGASHWIVICWGLLICWRRRREWSLVHKILLVCCSLLILNASVDRIRRIGNSSPPQKGTEVDILTYNLLFKNKYKAQIIHEIQQTKANIIFIQEITPAWNQQLASSIYPHYPHRKTWINRRTRGLAILSTFPISDYDLIKSARNIPFAQICNVTIKGKKVSLINAHLASPAAAVEHPEEFLSQYKKVAAERATQWDKLTYLTELKTSNKLTQPTASIIGGDLNTMTIEPLYRHIRHSWKDLFASKGSGWGATFPHVASIPFPLIKLDYILYQGSVKGLESRVLPGSSSDHFGLWGKVLL